MTLSIGKQMITIHMLPNISRLKNNQTIRFDQLIRYGEGKTRKLVPDLIFFFKKHYMKLKEMATAFQILVVLDLDMQQK